MLEGLAVVLGVGLLAAVSSLVAWAPPMTLLYTSAALGALGLLLGLSGGLLYHLMLRRELLRLGPLPRGWLWHPTRLHAQLPEPGLRRVWPWFALGATGFLLVMTGAGLATWTVLARFR